MLRSMGFKRVIGVDISNEMIKKARQLLDQKNCSGTVDLYISDVQNLKMIQSSSIDVCLALGVIEYQDEDAPLLTEINRILKGGGVAVLQVRNYNCIYVRTVKLYKKLFNKVMDTLDYHEHKPVQFRDSLREYGFNIEKERYSHYYALYPINVIPVFKRFIKPYDNCLSKYWEVLSPLALSRYLASMYIVSFRKLVG